GRFLFQSSFLLLDHYEPTHDLCRHRESSSCNGFSSFLYIEIVYDSMVSPHLSLKFSSPLFSFV
ncbi:unnamed protein product, partial [Brassica oleracea var. botrytis]